MTRGIKKNVDHFVNDMSAQYFPLDKEKRKWLQLAMRPIQLWECVFPKEYLSEIVNSMEIPEIPKHWAYGKKRLYALRKALHAKKIPAIDPKGMKRIIFHNDVHISTIGIKEDMHDDQKGHEFL